MSKDIIWKHRVSFAVPTHWVLQPTHLNRCFISFHSTTECVYLNRWRSDTDGKLDGLICWQEKCGKRSKCVESEKVQVLFEQCEMLLQGWRCSYLAFVSFNSRHVQVNFSHLEITVWLAKSLWLLVPHEYLLCIFLMLMPKPQPQWAFWKDQSLA